MVGSEDQEILLPLGVVGSEDQETVCLGFFRENLIHIFLENLECYNPVLSYA